MNIKKRLLPAQKRHNFLKLSRTQNGKLYFSPTFQKVELRNSTFFQWTNQMIKASFSCGHAVQSSIVNARVINGDIWVIVSWSQTINIAALHSSGWTASTKPVGCWVSDDELEVELSTTYHWQSSDTRVIEKKKNEYSPEPPDSYIKAWQTATGL